MEPVQWFHRSGEPVKLKVHSIKSDRATITVRRNCWRCGGEGGSENWKHTGWTCYRCGGSGLDAPRPETVYTAEKLAKLNEAQAKAAAKRVAKLQAKAAAERAAAIAIRAQLFRDHERLARRAWDCRHRSDFIRSILRQGLGLRPLTDNQIAALERSVDKSEEFYAARLAEQKRREAATFVGRLKERLTMKVKVIKAITGGDRYSPYGLWTLRIMRTDDGRTLTTFGQCSLEEGDEATITFTVKDHVINSKTGEKETQVFRIKVKE